MLRHVVVAQDLAHGLCDNQTQACPLILIYRPIRPATITLLAQSGPTRLRDKSALFLYRGGQSRRAQKKVQVEKDFSGKSPAHRYMSKTR